MQRYGSSHGSLSPGRNDRVNCEILAVLCIDSLGFVRVCKSTIILYVTRRDLREYLIRTIAIHMIANFHKLSANNKIDKIVANIATIKSY